MGMLHLPEILTNECGDGILAEQRGLPGPSFDVPYGAPLNPQVHQGPQEIPVGQLIGKFLRQGLDMDADDRKRHLIPELPGISEADHHPVRPVIAASEAVPCMGEPSLLLPEHILLAQPQKSRKGEDSLSEGLFRQVAEPVLQLLYLFFVGILSLHEIPFSAKVSYEKLMISSLGAFVFSTLTACRMGPSPL